MKSILSLIVVIASMQAIVASAEDVEFAAEDRILICSPSPTSINGLALAWARIEMSRENPEADLFYRIYSPDPRRSRKTFQMHYDTVGDGSEYELTPDSRDPNALFIGLKKIGRKYWEATLTNHRTRAISVLRCTEGEPSPIRG